MLDPGIPGVQSMSPGVYNSLQDLCADLIEWSVEPASSLRATLETCDLCVNVDISVTVDMSDMSDPTIKE